MAIRAVDWTIESALASGGYPQGETWRQEQAAEHVHHAFLHLENWLKATRPKTSSATRRRIS
jgi:hypothetical protein